jgi:formate dehydrogenase subunit gamma
MQSPWRRLICALALAFGCGAAALAQTTTPPDDPPGGKAPAGAPPGFVVPADPKPDESNAQRAQSQPGNNAPFWRGVRESGNQPGFTTLPDNEGATLIQRFTRYPGSDFTTAGEAWRQVRNRWIIPYGAALLVIALGALGLYYWRKGSMGHAPNTGRRDIERFTLFERSAHWTNAIAFVTLAISGVMMMFGKYLLLPIIGSTLFGWLTYALKTLHNFVGPLFAVSLVVVIITFVRSNIPTRSDVQWLKGLGKVVKNEEEPPSHRFNAGEKVVFWIGVFALGVVSVVSGLVLDKLLPGLDLLRGDMQIAHMVHAASAVLMMTVFALHIYLGTIGMRGAFRAMRTGYVDEEWAREHHALWAEDVRAGRIPAKRSSSPPPAGIETAKEGA